MLPSQNTVFWEKVTEDIFCSKAMKQRKDAYLALLQENQEWAFIGIDCSVRCLRRIKGQGDYRASKSKRDAELYPDGEAKRRCMAVTGRTSAVAVLSAIPDEKSENISSELSKLQRNIREQVLYTAVDTPSKRLYDDLKSTLINLEAMAADTIHLCINFEYAL